MIVSFFDEENLEFIESQIDAPENGYDSANEFAKKITQSVSWPSQVLSINSKTLLISSKIYNQTFSNQLIVLLLENSNSAKVLNRDLVSTHMINYFIKFDDLCLSTVSFYI